MPDIQLSAVEARVLGALIEKDMATPDYYPLSLNALVNACNQKTNRDPVMSLDERAVERALESLRHRGLALIISGADHRVPKHAHRISERLNLGNRELAILCVLLVRGHQTAGELRSRAQSLHAFDDLEAVQSCLERLTGQDLVTRLPPPPGMKESRYAHLLSGEPEIAQRPAPAPREPDRVERLETEIEALKDQLADLQRQFADFRRQFE